MTDRRRHYGNLTQGPGFSFCLAGRFLLLLSVMLLLATGVYAQQETPYDEISVYIKIPRIGGAEIDAVIKGEEVYLPVSELFDFLKIKNSQDSEGIISGFFITPEATFVIDRQNNRITYGGRVFQLEEGDLVKSETTLYLRSLWYGKIFGLDCKFSFRELSVTVDTKLELPAIREMRLEEMRLNLTRLKGEVIADTTIGRSYPAFRFGMADWSVYTNEQVGGGADARVNLTLGSMIAGGEATASLNYYTGDPLSEKQQYYLWRYVNNDHTLLRQVMAGKIVSHATSSIYDPVVGVQITNTPTTFRRSFGSYTLTDKTEPNWTVELYVNNVLVDYTKADASGFFTFEVPLVYGNSHVSLKFYGPWGEERTREQNITIPYNFLPRKTLEYTVSAGMVEDTLWSRFARGSFSYGATKFLTLGAGAEYLSSVSGSPLMPYVNASLKLSKNLMVSGEYTYGVRARGTLSYRLPSNMQLDLNYTRYKEGQQAINYNYLEERRISLSLPVRTKNFSAFSRMSVYQIVLPLSKYTTGEWMISSSVFGINTNLTTYSIFIGQENPFLYSNLSLGIRLPAGILLLPQLQYSYSSGKFMTAKAGLEKRILGKGYITTSFERNFRTNISMGELGIRYDFSFAQAGFSARRGSDQTTLVQYARGSLINDRHTDYLKADNRTNVGRGGVSIVAFLDLNANGVRDAGEPRAAGVNVHSSGGRTELSEKDTTIHILGLEPYVKYFIELDETGFDNISWRLQKKSLAVIIDPNILKLIEVPVSVQGEATGNIMFEEGGVISGLSRIIINFYDSHNNIAGRVLSEEGGFYSYFGLAPGSYTVRPDTAQLRKLKMTTNPDSLVFSIVTSEEGDYVDGLDFTLRKEEITTETIVTDTVKAPVTVRDTTYLIVHEETRELVTITEDYYAVQFGAFRNKAYAQSMRDRIASALDKNVELFEEDDFWKVRITGFNDRQDLDSYIPRIHEQGITELWIITNKAARRDWITGVRQDTVTRVTERDISQAQPQELPRQITGTTVQIGNYNSEAEMSAIIDRLLAASEKMVTVRKENGAYRVQITDFADTAEVRSFLPLLQKHGFTNVQVIPDEGTLIIPMAPQVEVIPAEPVEEVTPVITVPEELPAPPVFCLNVATFYKLVQAEKAKRKVEKKLNVPVEIIKEWDSYRVVLTGFRSREETYPYYPELAGLGFSDIFVFEKPAVVKQ